MLQNGGRFVALERGRIPGLCHEKKQNRLSLSEDYGQLFVTRPIVSQNVPNFMNCFGSFLFPNAENKKIQNINFNNRRRILIILTIIIVLPTIILFIFDC